MGMSPEAACHSSVLWKKNSSAPNYKPMAEATMYAVDSMERVADDYMAETRRQYDDMAPHLKEIAETQTEAMRQQMEQGEDYYNYMKDTFRPMEEGLVKDAEEFNTEEAREQMARDAAVDVSRADQVARDSNMRVMQRMGVNPNSARFQSMNKSQGLKLAGMKAGAMTNARERAQQLGYAKKLDAIGIGRGLPGASTAAYNSATNAGTAGANSHMAGGNFMLNGMGQAGNFVAQGANMGIQGNQAILNSQTSIANTNANNNASMWGTAAGLGAAAMMM